MTKNTITLGIAADSRSAQISSKNPAASASDIASDIKQKILERDNHSCRFCGFELQKYQDVLALDGNVSNQKDDNLLTACIFCHQCFDLEKVAKMRSGVLIWLPEVPQIKLHHIARAIYVARISQGSMADTAKKTLEILMARREEAKQRIHTDDPEVLAMVMRDFLGPRNYMERADKLDGVRLFPLDRRIIKEGDLEFNQFPQILAYWRSKAGPFGGKIPNQWKNYHAQMLEDLNNAA